jgi:undecaprenyl-diphosphatase
LAIALGVLQGLTEFLPVSSSGHLRLLEALFGVEDPQTFFDILLHLGSLVAVFIVFRAVFWRMITATGRVLRRPTRLAEGLAAEPDARLVLLAAVATVPTGLIGVLLGDVMEGLAGDIWVVGVALLVTAAILVLLGRLTAHRAASGQPGRSLGELRLTDALLVGTVQGLAVFRGISRSGSTITAGLAVGLDREASAALSFVLSVPAILGALVMKFDAAALQTGQVAIFAAGALASAVVGTLALLLLLRMLRAGRLHHFAWYCLALGLAAIVYGLLPGGAAP